MNVDTTTAESLASFAADGFVSLRQFVGGEEVAALRANVDRFITDVVPQMLPEQIFYEHKNDPATLKQQLILVFLLVASQLELFVRL